MKSILPCLILIVVAAPTSLARIGDSPAVCAATYGEIAENRPNGGMVIYRKDGILTTCWFDGEVCTALSYQLRSAGLVVRQELGKEPRFSESQTSALLNLNRGSSAWKQEAKGKFGQPFDGLYKTEDRKLQGLVNSFAITIESIPSYQRRLDQTQGAAIDQTIRSFSGGAVAEQPAIKHDAPLSPPTEAEVKMNEATKRLEDSQKKIEQNAANFKIQAAASDKALKDLSEHAALIAEWAEMEKVGKALVEKLTAADVARLKAKTPAEIQRAEAAVNLLITETNAQAERMKINSSRRKELMAAGR